MRNETMHTVIIPNDFGSRNRQAWFRSVSSVNMTDTGAKAFEGVYLKSGQEIRLQEGSIFIGVHPYGSGSDGVNGFHLYKIENGKILTVNNDCLHWKNQFETIRQLVIDHLKNNQSEESILSQFDTTELLAELEKRNVDFVKLAEHIKK